MLSFNETRPSTHYTYHACCTVCHNSSCSSRARRRLHPNVSSSSSSSRCVVVHPSGHSRRRRDENCAGRQSSKAAVIYYRSVCEAFMSSRSQPSSFVDFRLDTFRTEVDQKCSRKYVVLFVRNSEHWIYYQCMTVCCVLQQRINLYIEHVLSSFVILRVRLFSLGKYYDFDTINFQDEQ